VRNHVECDPLGKLLCLHFIEHEYRFTLGEQLVHRFLAGAGNGLIYRDHDTLDPRLLVQRLERDDELRGRPAPVYEVLRQVAFDERVKIHDLIMEGVEAVLRRRGYPSVERLKGVNGGETQAVQTTASERAGFSVSDCSSGERSPGPPKKAGVPKNQKNPDSTYAACVERLEIASFRPVPPFLRVMASLADP
jgi:hypothetical protein